MLSNRVWRWVAATVIAGLAVLGYALWIPVRQVNPHKVAPLVVTRPVHGFRAHPTSELSKASASPLRAVSEAAAAAPAQTAVDTVSWKGRTAKSASALVVMVLPTVHDARTARDQARTSYLGKRSLTSEGYGYAGALHLTGVPGAAGATYTAGTTPTITSATPRTDAEVFSVGRVVVVATAEDTGGSTTKAAVEALAMDEYDHLRRVGARPDLGETTFPLVASLVYAAVAAAVLVAVEVAPSALALVRRRREAAWEAALRRERASRGSKVVKRRAGRTPPPRSGSRRRAGTRGARGARARP